MKDLFYSHNKNWGALTFKMKSLILKLKLKINLLKRCQRVHEGDLYPASPKLLFPAWNCDLVKLYKFLFYEAYSDIQVLSEYKYFVHKPFWK